MGQEADDRSFAVSGLAFEYPETWVKETPQSRMRQAQLKVPGQEGAEAGEVVFFFFGPGNAGGTEANVTRWYRQFREPVEQLNTKKEAFKLKDGTKVTYVRAEGTFLSGPPLGAKQPKPGYVLLGAIIEDQAGYVFVKFTGPGKVVSAAAKDFRGMVASAVAAE